ncbi:MAG: NAD-dependent glucose-6-phosphate dehydrogenase Azf [Haloarculaceae archaeon]
MDEPVLLTGAGGSVGRAILEGIGDQYDWRLLFHNPPDQEPDHPYEIGDVDDADQMRSVVDGVDAVVHLAGDPRKTAPWDSVLQHNIHGTRNVLEAAVEADVSRVVFASSNHAVGHYETDRTPGVYRTDGDLELDGTELPRPGNLYGVSKAAGETLCRYYHDEYGLTAACVRIGNLNWDHPPEDYERGHAMWLSPRDCAHLHARCLEADYEFEIVYGISDNDRKFYSLERPKAVLGYEPRDNAADYNLDGTPTDES